MQSVPCNCIVYIAEGTKKDDPLSPAHVPSLFSFTFSLKRKIPEQSMNRYTASKRRKKAKVRNEATELHTRHAKAYPEQEDFKNVD